MSSEEQITRSLEMIESAKQELYKATIAEDSERIVTYSWLVSEYETNHQELVEYLGQ